jgi:hypothetical protein
VRAYTWMMPRLNTHDANAVGGALAAANRRRSRFQDDASALPIAIMPSSPTPQP